MTTRRCSCDVENKILLARIDERVGRLVESTGDQETRIRRLERWRNALAGAIAAMSTGLAKALHLGMS